MVNLDIYINSGAGYPAGSFVHYTEDSNISNINITNSYSDYYQNGIMTLYDYSLDLGLNDSVVIYINDSLEFDGYISRKRLTHGVGKKIMEYQLVGKTYDLWRYYINGTELYSGNTAYIASSLVASYCPGISGSYIDLTSGIEIDTDNALSFVNTTVGDSLVSLTNLDGKKFYVDSDNQLQYITLSGTYLRTITEDDIIDMAPIEQADEDIVNSVLVLGASDYSSKTTFNPGENQFKLTGQTKLACSFVASGDRLSAVKLKLDRTVDPNQPETLDYYVYTSTGTDLYNDSFDNDDLLLDYSNLEVTNGYLRLQTENLGSYNSYVRYYAEDTPWLYYMYNWIVPQIDGCLQEVWFSDVHLGGSTTFTLHVQSEDGLTEYGTATKTTGGGLTFTIEPPIKLFGGTTYKLYVDNNPQTAFYAEYISHGNEPSFAGGDFYRQTLGWYGLYTNEDADGPWNLYMGFILVKFKRSGTAKSLLYKNIDTKYILVSANTISGNHCYFSANNNGVNWYKTSSGVILPFPTQNTSSQAHYKISSMDNDFFSPRINSVYAKIGDSTSWYGSNWTTKPGTRIEWSDDISFSATDVPYNPQWTDWKTYSSPKLILNEGGTYYSVLSYTSSQNEMWYTYYISGSPYTSKIYHSTQNFAWRKLANSGAISIGYGYEYGQISAKSENQDSINSFGKHFRIINDSTLISESLTQARANYEVSSSQLTLRKGYFTIEGDTSIDIGYKLSANISNINLAYAFPVLSYMHNYDMNGFTTTINYGELPFSIARKIADLEREVY